MLIKRWLIKQGFSTGKKKSWVLQEYCIVYFPFIVAKGRGCIWLIRLEGLGDFEEIVGVFYYYIKYEKLV